MVADPMSPTLRFIDATAARRPTTSAYRDADELSHDEKTMEQELLALADKIRRGEVGFISDPRGELGLEPSPEQVRAQRAAKLWREPLLSALPASSLFPDKAIVFWGVNDVFHAASSGGSFDDQSYSVEVTRFKDGESKIKLLASVRDKDVYLVHSTSSPVNDSLVELIQTLDGCKQHSAARVTVLMPYFGYARQERPSTEDRNGIPARLMAKLIEEAGADRVILFDIHAEQIAGFFRKPVENIFGTHVLLPAIERYLQAHTITSDNLVVVSPDAGGTKRARAVAKALTAHFGLVDKLRPRPNEVAEMVLLGDVKGKVCILVDDMIDTGSTLVQAAELLKKNGARSVIAAATHGLFSDQARERIEASSIDKVFVTDSIYQPPRLDDTIEVLPLAPLLTDAIYRMARGESCEELRRF